MRALPIVLALALLSCSSSTKPPSGDDLPAWSEPRISEGGAYRLTASSSLDPLAINRIHDWTVRIESMDGTPVENARVVVDGGMPEHQHGLPTRPEVTRYLGNGEYLVEGMKFNMTGLWELKFGITDGDRTDTVILSFLLE